MQRIAARLLIVFIACTAWAQTPQKGAPPSAPQRAAHVLTDDEKEILKHRELLENLELLQNFEKIKYLDFLAARKADKNKEKKAPKPVAKADERKDVNP